ncbi:SGNH/GDSL hydrolase family protein [Oligoflexus tunisiensis]|uniref:SGNH/GDSL hydrolase family protein n=1 Tax=Oligoflexus tunisiensis TaxID=708132 RepID=UPI00114D08BB|nr:SGNH/GDSL hydrolase family protein [Oligoflexus tunisiensis]
MRIDTKKRFVFSSLLLLMVGILLCFLAELGAWGILAVMRDKLELNELGGLSLTGRPAGSEVSFKSGKTQVVYKTNDLGFRDATHSTTNKANRIRVAVYGDSFTEGWGVDQDKIFPVILEKLLNQGSPERRFEVLNFGLQGTGPNFMSRVFDLTAARYCPDIVVFNSFVGNDFIDAANALNLDRSPLPENFERPYFATLFELLVDHKQSWEKKELEIIKTLPAYQNLDKELRRAAEAYEVHLPLLRFALQNPNTIYDSLIKISDEQRTAYEEALARTMNLLTERGIRHFLLTATPFSVQVSKEQFQQFQQMGFSVTDEMLSMRKPQEAIAAIVDNLRPRESATKLTYRDLLGDFKAASNLSPLYLEYDLHIAEAGHNLIAHSIADEILRIAKISDVRRPAGQCMRAKASS